MLPARNSTTPSHTVLRLVLGPLETRVMEVLWADGHSSVRDVVKRLDPDMAYTTIMTTLDRLYRKHLVHRRKRKRAYIYWPRVTAEYWKNQVARDVVAKLLAGPDSSRKVLLACLLETVAQQDALLLDEIERVRNPRLAGIDDSIK